MEQWELLDRQRHAGLRVSAAGDAARHFVQLVADEIVPAALHYPVLFTRHPDTGALYAGAVMGLKPGENHALGSDGRLPYRPADLERQGFFVSGENIAIDPAHAAFVGGGESDPVFDMDGEPAPALHRVQAALRRLHKGLPETETLLDRFMGNGLIEPIDLSFQFDDGERLRLEALYTISLDALHALPDAVVVEMFRAGDLQIAYAQTGSLHHIPTLARRRNDRLAGLPA
jgi:hypothetical protein